MTITITLTATEAAALSLVTIDAQEWIANAASARAVAAMAELKLKPEWMQAIQSAAIAGVALTDEGAVLLHGLANGIIKTLAQLQAEQAAEPA